jgi:HAD superfamily hydrolase (TIGR01549 family)
MTLTLLFDLDDTLLANNIQDFMPAYLQAWGQFIAPYMQVDKFIRKLLTATHRMATVQRPDCTLQEIFEESFFPLEEIETRRFAELQAQFYDEIFPTLDAFTQPVAGAVDVVRSAFERGYRVAIATNPFFPQTAIEQRLAWAGLPVDQFPFELVPSYETMHFTKPNPAFFGEVLARLGWPEGPVVVIGDDLERDIEAAQRCGLASYWIQDQDSAPPAEAAIQPNGAGRIGDLLAWLDNASSEMLQPKQNGVDRLLASLNGTSAAIDSICRNLSPAAWRTHIEPGEWSPVEVVAHLRDVEREVNLPRLQKILSEDNPFLPGVDSDRWAAERRYIDEIGNRALHGFISARMQTVDLLVRASEQDWERPARHAIFGRTYLKELVSFTVGHDQIHTRQLLKDLKGGSTTSPAGFS